VVGVLSFRGRLGLELGHESKAAKRWGQAVAEVRDKALASASGGVSAAGRVGAGTFDRATEAFRAVDIDGDGIPDRPRAVVAAESASAAVKGAASGVTGAIGSMLSRKTDKRGSYEKSTPETTSKET
jgi:hypothetical protein